MSVGDYSQSKGDEAVRAATGRTWAEWFAVLDAEQLGERPSHQEIVAAARKHGAGAWWGQGVAVGYEQERGLREPGQRRDGFFTVSVSKSVAAEPDAALDRLVAVLKPILGAPASENRAAKYPTVRFIAEPGRILAGTNPPKGEKVTANLTWERLPEGEDLEARKAQLRGLLAEAFGA